MRSAITLLTLLAGGLSAAEPIPASVITLDDKPRTVREFVTALEQQTGNAIADNSVTFVKPLSFTLKKEQFWNAAERLAIACDCQLFVNPKTGLSLVPRKQLIPIAPLSTDGPFRVVARSVTLRQDFLLGTTRHEVTLEVQWEPRLRVFRIDAQPTITKAEDDRGTVLTTERQTTKSAIGGTCSFTTTISLDGLTREARSIARLDGTITVTASPKMLAFAFKDLATLPASEVKEGVTVTLAKLAAAEGRVDVQMKLEYPEGHPEFESFESWTDFNTLKLIAADRTRTWSPENFSVNGSGRRVTADYRVPKFTGADLAGASAVYETPAPLVEFPVKFSLKDISLP